MSTKRLQTGCFVVSTELGILGQLGAFGQDRMEKVVYFIVVPCYHVPKPRDVDKKTPNWVFCGIDRDGHWVFWGRMEKVFHFIVVPCCQGCQI